MQAPPRWLLALDAAGEPEAASALSPPPPSLQKRLASAQRQQQQRDGRRPHPAPRDRADSFAFERDTSRDALAQTEQAATAVHAWHKQHERERASGSSSTEFASSPPSPCAVRWGRAGIDSGGDSDAEAPSNAEALPAGRAAPRVGNGGSGGSGGGGRGGPPGSRRRRAVEGAQLELDSAATLEDWSKPASEQASPRLQQDGATAPQQQQLTSRLPPGSMANGLPDSSSGGGSTCLEAAATAVDGQAAGDGDDIELDCFAAAFSRVRGIRARRRPRDEHSDSQSPLLPEQQQQQHSPHVHRLAFVEEEPQWSGKRAPPARQWHLFTGL